MTRCFMFIHSLRTVSNDVD